MKTLFRRICHVFVAIILSVTVASATTTSARADAPRMASTSSSSGEIVANDDHFTFWAGSAVPWLDVEPNDQVNDQARTPIVGLNHLSEGKDGLKLYGGGIIMNMPRDRKTDIEAEYRRQDPDTGDYTNWAHIYIHVKPTTEVKPSQPRPGRLKLTNPNDGAVFCVWGTRSGSADGPDGQTHIKAHSSKVVPIHRKTLYLICSIGQHSATVADRMLRHLK